MPWQCSIANCFWTIIIRANCKYLTSRNCEVNYLWANINCNGLHVQSALQSSLNSCPIILTDVIHQSIGFEGCTLGTGLNPLYLYVLRGGKGRSLENIWGWLAAEGEFWNSERNYHIPSPSARNALIQCLAWDCKCSVWSYALLMMCYLITWWKLVKVRYFLGCGCGATGNEDV